MAKTWRKYESLILYSAELDTDGSEALLERFREFIRSADGRMLKTERWGLRDMAFEIKHNKKAHYVLLEYAGEGPVSNALHHQLNLLDTVIKFQTIKLEDRVDPADLPETEEIIGDLEAPAEEAEQAEATEEAAAESPAEEAAPEAEATEEAVTEEAATEEASEEQAPAEEEATEEAAPEATDEDEQA